MHPDRPLPAEVERVRADVEPDVKGARAAHRRPRRRAAPPRRDPARRRRARPGRLLGPRSRAASTSTPRAPGARRRRGGLRPASPHLPPLPASTGSSCATRCRWWSTSPTSPPRCSTPGAGQPGGPLRAGPAPTGRMARWGGRDTACCRCRWRRSTGSCAGSPAGRTRRTCRATGLHPRPRHRARAVPGLPRRRRDRAGAARGGLGGGLRGGAGAGGALPRRHAPPRAGARRALPRAHRATGRGLPAVPALRGAVRRAAPAPHPRPGRPGVDEDSLRRDLGDLLPARCRAERVDLAWWETGATRRLAWWPLG